MSKTGLIVVVGAFLILAFVGYLNDAVVSPLTYGRLRSIGRTREAYT